MDTVAQTPGRGGWRFQQLAPGVWGVGKGWRAGM